MVVFKDKTDCIEQYQAIGRPLDMAMIDDMEEVTQELHDADLDQRWVLMDLVCRVCGHEQTFLVPIICDLDNLECMHCENMTSQEKEEADWWQS